MMTAYALHDHLERRQALLRVSMLTLITIYIGLAKAGNANFAMLLSAAGSFLIFAILWFGLVVLKWFPCQGRRYSIILVDAAMISAGMWIAGIDGAMFYPLYLFVTVGHGMRFGPSYLLTSIAASCVGFLAVVSTHPYWQDHQTVTLPLLAGLVVLPLYYLSLINRLNHANRQLQEELRITQQQAKYDRLTGLPNRSHFFATLEQRLTAVTSRKVSVLFIDLDGFKAVNDSQGHGAGDQVLKDVATRLGGLCQSQEMVARLGGDEFIMVVNKVRTKCLVTRCQRILAELTEVGHAHGALLSASIGISRYPQDGVDADALVAHADVAMYQVKNQRKNGYAFYEPGISRPQAPLPTRQKPRPKAG